MSPLPGPRFDLDAPGSVIYDGVMAARGMRLNRFGNSFKIAANRDAFKADPQAYLASADLTPEERDKIAARDWTWLLAHGGHIQAMQRIAEIEGQYLFHIAAHCLGVSVEDLAATVPRRVRELGKLDG